LARNSDFLENEVGRAHSKSKRTRDLPPPRLRTPAGRLAWRLWREDACFRKHPSRFLDWVAKLDDKLFARIDRAISRFASYSEFQAAYLKRLRPKAVLLEAGPDDLLFHQLCEKLAAQITVDEFTDLLRAPAGKQKQNAEDFGKRVTRILKDSLDVRPHRQKVKPSQADLDDDNWRRRLAAYIFNFPEKFS